MGSPRVSVVVPFRDQGLMLIQACRSLQAQTMGDWEGLLIDDGSAAPAHAVAEAVVNADRRFTLLTLARTNLFPGPWLARNVGINRARAPLVAFLDADDLWHPLKLERQLPLHQAGGVDLSVTGYDRFEADGLRIKERRLPPPQLDGDALMRGNVIPLSTVLIRRDLLADGFLPERHEDYGLWLRIFAATPPPRYGCIAEPLMAYRLHSGSLSAGRLWSLLAVERLLRRPVPDPWQRALAMFRWLLGQANSQLWNFVRRSSGRPQQLASVYRRFLE